MSRLRFFRSQRGYCSLKNFFLPASSICSSGSELLSPSISDTFSFSFMISLSEVTDYLQQMVPLKCKLEDSCRPLTYLRCFYIIFRSGYLKYPGIKDIISQGLSVIYNLVFWPCILIAMEVEICLSQNP